MSKEEQEQTVSNIAGHIQGAKNFTIARQIENFRKADPALASKIEEALLMKKKSAEPYTMIA
jgi:catalase